MAKLISNVLSACSNKVPEKFVLPPGKRQDIDAGKIDIPIIDLHDEKNIIQKIMNASLDFGVFQVINHGVAIELMDNSMKAFNEIFAMPPEEKCKINMEEDLDKMCSWYTSSMNYEIEEFHCWREVLRHECYPIKKCMKFWPQKPENYRDLIGTYVTSMKEMGMRLLELISEGLGLEQGFFANELTAYSLLTINHYPQCPDPSVTMGLPKHKDPTIINMVQPYPVNVPGLQILKDDKWFNFDVAPDALLIFVGNQLEVISNGILRASVHRVVTNAIKDRTSAVFFMTPSMECIVEPAKALLQAQNSTPNYRSFTFKEYFDIHISQEGDRDAILEKFNFMITS